MFIPPREPFSQHGQSGKLCTMPRARRGWESSGRGALRDGRCFLLPRSRLIIKKGVRGDTGVCLTIKATPIAPFIKTTPQLLLELQVVIFDVSAHLQTTEPDPHRKSQRAALLRRSSFQKLVVEQGGVFAGCQPSLMKEKKIVNIDAMWSSELVHTLMTSNVEILQGH